MKSSTVFPLCVVVVVFVVLVQFKLCQPFTRSIQKYSEKNEKLIKKKKLMKQAEQFPISILSEKNLFSLRGILNDCCASSHSE